MMDYLPRAKSFSKYLDDAQVKHTFYKIPGAHTWIVWRQFLQEFAPQLFRCGVSLSWSSDPYKEERSHYEDCPLD